MIRMMALHWTGHKSLPVPMMAQFNDVGLNVFRMKFYSAMFLQFQIKSSVVDLTFLVFCTANPDIC